jgi:hypothetical protein
MSGYMGLLMGCSRPYWIGILQKIYKTYGTGKWSWNDVRKNFPEISNSDMRRLNCSNWFIKSGKDNKTSLWQLQPDAVNICRIDINQAQKQIINKKAKPKSNKH